MSATSLHALGYLDLVSVIPPDAELTPSSTIKPESRGKSPGVLYPSGWGGYNWRLQQPTAAFVEQMDTSGANVGLAAARFPAIDVDVKDPGLAKLISEAIEDLLPTGPLRVGLPPKRLYLFRLAPNSQPFTKLQLIFEFAGERQLVEVLGVGQQYLIEGLHAKTKEPYTYPVPLTPADALPTLDRELADAVLGYIAATVLDPFCIPWHRSGTGALAERGLHNQEHLKADDLVELAMAVGSMRDTEEFFPSRQEYIKLGFALRAATQDDPEIGLTLFQNWAATKDWGPANDPDQVARDWASFHSPFELGAEYVFDLAHKFGYGYPGDEFDLEPAPSADEVRQSRPSKGSTRRAESQHSDMWLTDRLIDEFGEEIVWQPQREKFLTYENGIWKEDTAARVPNSAREICVAEANRIQLQGATEREKKDATAQAKALSSSRQMESILRLAAKDPRIIVQQDRFDANPDWLGTPDGVIDLLTGERIEPRPDMFISKSTTIAPSGEHSPLWRQFLDDACAGDVEFEEYLQKVAGYCLTAHTYENLLFFLWGEGKRGKSTFVDTLSAVLGSYAKVAQMSTFTAKKTDRHTTELAALAGSRLVTAQETQENEYWDEARVKSLTGGDSITARFLFKDDFTFTPGFKLLFSGNSRPKITNPDAAMRRRVHLIPFNNLPKNPDPRFKDKLKQNELPGVLTWMIEGALLWRKFGLKMPKIVDEATAAYFEQEDPIGRWQRDCLVWEGSCSGTRLYQSWVDWCDAHGESASTQRKFMTMATNRGMRRGADVNGQMMFAGVSLKSDVHVPVAGEEFQKEMVQ